MLKMEGQFENVVLNDQTWFLLMTFELETGIAQI